MCFPILQPSTPNSTLMNDEGVTTQIECTRIPYPYALVVPYGIIDAFIHGRPWADATCPTAQGTIST